MRMEAVAATGAVGTEGLPQAVTLPLKLPVNSPKACGQSERRRDGRGDGIPLHPNGGTPDSPCEGQGGGDAAWVPAFFAELPFGGFSALNFCQARVRMMTGLRTAVGWIDKRIMEGAMGSACMADWGSRRASPRSINSAANATRCRGSKSMPGG